MEQTARQKNRAIVIVSWILVFLWMGFIFYMSAQDSTSSSSFSRPIAESAAKNLAKFHFIPENKMLDNAYITELESTIRKIAHSTVFFVLSVLVSLSLIASGIKGARVLVISIALSLLYAFADEFHQFFVPGRATEMADIFLDMFGLVLGTVLVVLASGLLRKTKKTAKSPAKQTTKPLVSAQQKSKVLEFKKKQEKEQEVIKSQPKKQKAKETDAAFIFFIKLGAAVSFAVLCAIVSSNVKYMPISAILALAVSAFIIFKTKVIDTELRSISVPKTIIAFILSIFTIIRVYASFRLAANAYIAELGIVIDDLYYNFIRSGLSAFAVPSIMIIWYVVLGKAKLLAEKIKFTKPEIAYIAILTGGVSAVLLYVYYRTSVFYNPIEQNNVIFSIDTNTIINEFSFTNFNSSANTIFQPLFSLAAMPFGVLSRIISYPISILPGYDMAGAEALALSIVNAALLGATALIFTRALGIKNKALFIAIITVSFPALFSLIVPSGGIVIAFYAAILIYIAAKTDWSYVPTLTVILSAFLPFAAVPIVLGRHKKRAANAFKAYAYLAILIVLLGNISGYPDIIGTIKHVPRIQEILPSVLRTSFMSLFAPLGAVNSTPYYTLDVATPTFSYAIGAAILLLAALGFISNRKEIGVRVSAIAVLIGAIFSLYFVAALNTSGIIPFLMCFSWAFIALIYKLFEKILNPHKMLFKIIAVLSAIVLLVYNYNYVRDIIVFAFNYY